MTYKVLLDFANPHRSAAPPLRHAFSTPHQVLQADCLEEVRAVLDAVYAAAQQGRWCVGYVRYEAAAAFDAALQTHPADGPLAWFGVYGAPLPWPEEAPPANDAQVAWHSALERTDFNAAVARIQQAIAAGELYQVNYTAPLTGTLQQGSSAALFAALQRAQPGGYAAHIDTGTEQVLSVSPELFCDGQDAPGGGTLLTRPLNGTAARGATHAQDAANAHALRASPKERAENVMIVDLLRNDLSRIAKPHSVRVPVLFHTQALPSVWQMTSDVQARTRPGTTLADVFAALFPCGSVTGAPKVRAMQMVRALEPAPRGVYCGAVGVVRPAGATGADGRYQVAATFNVPIRTVVLRAAASAAAAAAASSSHGSDTPAALTATCGIGSGITSGAEPEAEWKEWRHKRAFVERASTPFDLLETLALEGGQFRHLADHLARLQSAAIHFNVPFDATVVDSVQRSLQALAERHPHGLWRVRLLLNAAGRPHAQAFALQPTLEPVRLQLATRPFLEAHSEFVRFKTTRRAHYAAFAPNASEMPGVFDTLLWNEDREMTESTFGNIAMLLDDGRWVTPPLSCGLLPGVGRAVALRQGRVQEAVVRLDDLPRVRGWAFVNSLRGWLDAELVKGA